MKNIYQHGEIILIGVNGTPRLKAGLIDTGAEGTQLYECQDFMGTGTTEYCMKMKDWSTDRTFIEFVPPEIGNKKSAVFAQASAFGWLMA